MGLFKKRKCSFCETKIGLMNTGRRFKDGELCCDCSEELSLNWKDTAKFTLADAVEHIEYRKKNLEKLKNSFNPDQIFGFRPTIYIDSSAKLWCVSLGGADESKDGEKRYVNENCDLFTFEELSDTMISTLSDDKHILEVKIKNHPWITTLKFSDKLMSDYKDMLCVDRELRRILFIK